MSAAAHAASGAAWQWTRGRIVALVAGCLAAIVAALLVAGGGFLVWAHSTQRDSEGYYTTGLEPLATSSYAITAERLTLGHRLRAGPARWAVTEWPARVKVSAQSRNGKPVFIGIAPQRDVTRYLGRSEHAEVRDFGFGPHNDVRYREHPGMSAPATPAGESFWAASASGPGRQELRWKVHSGDWAVVVMNANAQPGVDADVSVGARVSWLIWVGIGMLALGLPLLGGAIVLAGSAVAYARNGGPPPGRRPAGI